jgi:hypothetical protein
MKIMILDVLAGIVLLVLWLFGGALLFDSPHTKYQDVLLGWSTLNALVIGATLVCWALMWAIERLFT